MAFTYGFYNSLNGDRRYKSEDFGKLLSSLITDGVLENSGQKLFTTVGTGMEIHVGTGKAWFDDTWNDNDSVLVLEVPQSDITRPRYDTVVLDINNDISVRENKIMIVSGDPAVNPTKPVLINTEKHKQHPLAHILVPAAATEITASNVEIVVGQTVCPFATSILQQTDITDLYNGWEADFQSWFNNLKDQLTSNVVTNLQSQIDTLRGEVEGLSDGVDGISESVEGINTKTQNSLDAGSIFMLANGYNKPIVGALPCTGGSYSPTAYPTLFSRIGYSYGGDVSGYSSINFDFPTTMYTHSSLIKIDPYTKHTYVLATSNSNGSGSLYLCEYDENMSRVAFRTIATSAYNTSLYSVSHGIMQFVNNGSNYFSKDSGVTIETSGSINGAFQYIDSIQMLSNLSYTYLVVISRPYSGNNCAVTIYRATSSSLMAELVNTLTYSSGFESISLCDSNGSNAYMKITTIDSSYGRTQYIYRISGSSSYPCNTSAFNDSGTAFLRYMFYAGDGKQYSAFDNSIEVNEYAQDLSKQRTYKMAIEGKGYAQISHMYLGLNYVILDPYTIMCTSSVPHCFIFDLARKTIGYMLLPASGTSVGFLSQYYIYYGLYRFNLPLKFKLPDTAGSAESSEKQYYIRI